MADPIIAPPFSLPARWPGSLTDLQEDIRRRHVAAQKGNIRVRSVMASPPTVTIETSAPGAPFTNYPSTVSEVSAYDGVVRFCGGWLLRNASFVYTLGATRTIDLGTRASGSGNGWQTSTRAAFWFDGDVAFCRVNCSQKTRIRLIVDGQYADATGVVVDSANATRYIRIDFTAAGGRKPRLLQIELQGGPETSGGSIGLQQFGFLYKTPADRIWAPSDEEIGPRIGIFGDSWTYGPIAGQVTTTMQGDGFGRVLGDLLGLSDVICSGVTGTGWIARSGDNTLPDLLNRIHDVTETPMDVCVIANGINDNSLFGTTIGGVTISNATIQARVTETLAVIRAARPTLPIVVLGPWKNEVATAAARAQGVEDAIAAGVATLADNRIRFVPTIAPSLIDGTGKDGATNGSGNSDVYICNSGGHLTLPGHVYVAQRIAPAIVDAVLSMR